MKDAANNTREERVATWPCKNCGKGPTEHSVVGYTVICRHPMLEPVGALALPRWKYILRSLSAVLATEGQSLSPEYRETAARQLGDIEDYIASLEEDRA